MAGGSVIGAFVYRPGWAGGAGGYVNSQRRHYRSSKEGMGFGGDLATTGTARAFCHFKHCNKSVECDEDAEPETRSPAGTTTDGKLTGYPFSSNLSAEQISACKSVP